MKKITALVLALGLTMPVQAWFWHKVEEPIIIKETNWCLIAATNALTLVLCVCFGAGLYLKTRESDNKLREQIRLDLSQEWLELKRINDSWFVLLDGHYIHDVNQHYRSEGKVHGRRQLISDLNKILNPNNLSVDVDDEKETIDFCLIVRDDDGLIIHRVPLQNSGLKLAARILTYEFERIRDGGAILQNQAATEGGGVSKNGADSITLTDP
ncbi:MAG: hypothetical protein LBL71_02470 [Endomicrobium sp.]|jgi:hypothetical protein|nr:hypothetical protein [Endomicrobium sp.]